jgi:hypothetical protein
VAARQPVGIRHPVTAQTLPQILGFADVKHRVRGVAHEVNAGVLRQLAEKIPPQALDERSRVRKQQCLISGHDSG